MKKISKKVEEFKLQLKKGGTLEEVARTLQLANEIIDLQQVRLMREVK